MFSCCRAHERLALRTLWGIIALTLSAGCMGDDDGRSSKTWGIDDANNPNMMSAKPTISSAQLPRGLNSDDPNLEGDCGVSLCPSPWEDKPKRAVSCRELLKIDSGDGLKVVSNQLKLYNERGLFIEVREADNVVLLNDYNERELLSSTRTFLPNGAQDVEVRYVYNDQGLLTQAMTSERGVLTRKQAWTYDELGRVSSLHNVSIADDGDEGDWTFYRYEGYVAKTYLDSNENGQLDLGVDSVFTDYTYDSSGQLLFIRPYLPAYGGPNLNTEHRYNELNKLIAIVNKKTDDGSSSVVYDFNYDSSGHLLLIRETPERSVSVDGDEVFIRDRLELKRTNGAVTNAAVYGSFKEEPLVTLQLTGSMCERSLRDWRRFFHQVRFLSCGTTPCVRP